MKDNQKQLYQILGKTISNCSFEKGCKYLQLELPEKIPTKNGYQKQQINFTFSNKGRLENISISISDFAMIETDKSGSIINQINI